MAKQPLGQEDDNPKRCEGGNGVDVDLRVIHPIFGEVFGYRGTFQTVRYPKKG